MSYIAVFMDRDGTICEEIGFLSDLSKLRLIEGSAEAIRMINATGMKVVVVTNQSGVGRGLFTEDFVDKVHEELRKMLEKEGAFLDGVYYCPHLPDAGCLCRKPESGMLQMASKDMDIDLKRSYMVGDKAIDIELAHKAGAKGVMVRTGYGEEELNKFTVHPGLAPQSGAGSSLPAESGITVTPDYLAENLLDAVKWIVKDKQADS